MKFSGYEARTQLNTAAPRVQAPGNTLAYGTGGAAFQAASRGLGQISAVVAKKQEEDDTQDLLDARNKIMTSLTEQMYNSETGFMTNGYGENAKGLTGKVTEAVRNTFADVAKDYNGRVQNALQKTMRENFDNFQRIAASRESSEAVKMKGVRYETGLKDSAQQCGLNYNNDEVIKSQLEQGLMLTNAMGMDLGLPGAAIVGRQREMYTSNIGAAVNSAVQQEDYSRAFDLLQTYKKDMDNSKWNEMYARVKKGKEIRENDRIARDIARVAYSNGHFNANIARQEIDKLYGPDGLDRPGMFNYLESQRGKAYGLGSDGQEATDCGLLVQNAAAAAGYTFESRAADMQYYQLQKEGSLVSKDQARPGDVVFWHVPGSRWTYTDDPNGDETTAYKGVTHTGILLDNGMVMQAGSSGVTEMDLDQYEVVGIGRLHGSYDPERERQINSLVRAYGSDYEREYKHEKAEMLENLADQMQAAGSHAGALNLIEEADLDAKDKLKMQNMAKRMYGSSSGSGTYLGTQTDYVPGENPFRGVTKYTAKEIERDRNIIADYTDKMELDEKISLKEWQRATRAMQKLRATGNIPQDVENEVTAITSDPAFYSELTAKIKEYGIKQTMEWLMEAAPEGQPGTSREAAMIISLQINHKFFDHMNDWDNGDPPNT